MISGEDFKDPFEVEKMNKDYKVSEVRQRAEGQGYFGSRRGELEREVENITYEDLD